MKTTLATPVLRSRRNDALLRVEVRELPGVLKRLGDHLRNVIELEPVLLFIIHPLTRKELHLGERDAHGVVVVER